MEIATAKVLRENEIIPIFFKCYLSQLPAGSYRNELGKICPPANQQLLHYRIK